MEFEAFVWPDPFYTRHIFSYLAAIFAVIISIIIDWVYIMIDICAAFLMSGILSLNELIFDPTICLNPNIFVPFSSCTVP